MNLREQFEKEHGFPHYEDYTVYIEWLEDQMQQHAIEFAEQTAADGWLLVVDSKWINTMDAKIPEDKEYTTEQLYERFNKQKP